MAAAMFYTNFRQQNKTLFEIYDVKKAAEAARLATAGLSLYHAPGLFDHHRKSNAKIKAKQQQQQQQQQEEEDEEEEEEDESQTNSNNNNRTFSNVLMSSSVPGQVPSAMSVILPSPAFVHDDNDNPDATFRPTTDVDIAAAALAREQQQPQRKTLVVEAHNEPQQRKEGGDDVVIDVENDDENFKEEEKIEEEKNCVSGACRAGLLFYTEFRYIVLTVLLVIAALTLQTTIEDALNYFIRSRYQSPGKRIGMMFLFSFVIIIVVIVIVMLWKPINLQLMENGGIEVTTK